MTKTHSKRKREILDINKEENYKIRQTKETKLRTETKQRRNRKYKDKKKKRKMKVKIQKKVNRGSIKK